MKSKQRLLVLAGGFLLLAWIGSDIIRDIINLIAKNNLGNQITNLFVFILTFSLILLMLKISPFNELDNELKKFFDKKQS